MKFNILLAFIAATEAHRLRHPADGDAELVIPKEDDPFIEVPVQKISVNDPHHMWGHETQRVGNDDWLDGHVLWRKDNQKLIPAFPEKEDRTAIADS